MSWRLMTAILLTAWTAASTTVVCAQSMPPLQNANRDAATPASAVRQASFQEPVLMPPRPPETIGSVQPTDQSAMPTADGKFSLQQLTEISLTINPIMDRAQSDIEAAKGERVQAGLYPNPRMETNNPEIWAGQNSFVNFGFQQDIVVKGKIRIMKAAADQLVRRESADFQLDRARMLMHLRNQYYQSVAANQRYVLANYIIQVAGQSVNAAKQLQRGGEGSLTDVLLLENELQRAYMERDRAQTMLEGELKQLAVMTGARDLVILDVEGSLFDQPPAFDENAVRNFVSTDSSFMERARADIVRNEALLRKEEADVYPNLRMGPSFQTGTIPHSGQFWLSIVFDIPVWDLNQGNIRQAQARVRGAEAELEVTRNELLTHTAEVYSRYRASKQMADRLRSVMLPNSQRAIQLVQEGFAKGQFDVNRLLQAQRTLSDIAREHIEAAEKAWTAAAELSGLMQLESFGN